MKTESLTYGDAGTEMRGCLVRPAASEPRPGVVVFHAAPGLDDSVKERVTMLAGLGYVALGADLYGGGIVAGSGEEALRLMGAVQQDTALLRSRARAALDALAARPEVRPGALGATGYCFGGHVALELARSGAPLAAVVTFHGGLATRSKAQPGVVRAGLLICTGSADPLIPPEQRLAFEEEMTDAGAEWEIAVYSGAQHGFTNRASDKMGRAGFAYQERADRRSWAAMHRFFEESFAA